VTADERDERDQALAQARQLGESVDRLVREIIIAQDALDRARESVEERPPRPPEQPRRHRWRFPF
jgi:hypothetical protein